MTGEHTLDAVMAVMDAAFDPRWREAWSRVQVRDSLVLPGTFALVIDAGGRLLTAGDPAEGAAGFVLSRQVLDEEELLLIAIHPAERGRGLGARLLARHASECRRRGVQRIYLEMRANNPAHAFYTRGGYEPIGRRPGYYRTTAGELIDAVTFSRKLTRK